MSSKKIQRIIIIMVVLLVFAIGGYLIADGIIKKQEQAAADEEASLHLFSFDANSINAVTLDTQEGFFRMEIVDSEWAITETDYPHDFILNTAYVSTVCSYMSELTAEKKFEIDPTKLADYGLADPVVLTCYSGAAEYTLYVGNATPTQEYFYVMVPGNDTVFGITFEYGSVLYGDTSYLKSLYLLNCYDVDVAEIALEREGQVIFDLELHDDLWTMTAPYTNVSINSAQVNSMITALVRLQLDSFIGHSSMGYAPADYGLDNPQSTLRIETVDGESIIIDFASYDVNDGAAYLLYRNDGEIAEISTGNLGFLNTELSELINETILPVDFTAVASVDASVDDISFRMEMDAASEQYTFDGLDVSELGTDGPSTFRALFDTMANLTFEALDMDANVDVTAEPSAVFHYTMADGTETELSLIAADDSTYYALVDGEYTGMTVRRRSLSGSAGVLTFHERMMDLIAEVQANAS